jgi:hypothetical protein
LENPRYKWYLIPIFALKILLSITGSIFNASMQIGASLPKKDTQVGLAAFNPVAVCRSDGKQMIGIRLLVVPTDFWSHYALGAK